MKLTFEHGWDIGRRRETNEDSYLTWQAGSPGEVNGDPFGTQELASLKESPDLPLGLFLVADGVGGAAAGEVASRMAVESVARQVIEAIGSGEASGPDRPGWGAALVGAVETFARQVTEGLASSQSPGRGKPEWGEVIKAAVGQANREIRAARLQAGNDMGTTLVGALIVGSTAYVVNVGDSRAYLIIREGFRQITRDHSVVQYLVASGQIREEDARTHPQRNIILRSLGDQANVEVDLFPTALEPDQNLLLCSDGLWEMMRDDDIQRIVSSKRDLRQAAEALVALANENGGTDNISAILVRLEAT